MELRDWTESTLWSELQAHGDTEGRATASLLNDSMPGIQAALAQGGTAETDFTLHDSGHAFRVAQRMIDIMPPSTLSSLSCYEKALLLMSAYLHDIGMTPRKSRTVSVQRYLLTGDQAELCGSERRHVQEWLDDYRGGIVPPIAPTATVAALETAEELVTYYARHRHNDWSEEWIREYFFDRKMGTYAGWLEDLILLCRSHHYGYDELRQDCFLPRIVGGRGVVVNLRYLAAVLRIADVIEFDPERTPPVIFKHRDVSAGSAIYWHKDHEISMRIESGRVVLFARPNSARIHKAIEDTVTQIDEELGVCKRLAEELPFRVCPALAEPTGHEWNLASTTHARIEPLRNSYEYINGAFRPNTSRILNLLSGVELYGNPFAAVRELLQNAMDAIREQIAYVRLRRENPANECHGGELARSHVVSLRVETDEKGYWLICADSGVGMNKRIIRDYLLISGQSYRHDILELERRCQESGFSVGRTGQFGIGVLSYFMIASRIEISTRRSHESGSFESHGWHFSSDGIGSFGELRIDKRIESGTTVRLLLRPNVLGGSPQDWAHELARYSAQTLRKLPCRFEIVADALGLRPTTLQPGWVSTTDEIREQFSENLQRELRSSIDADIPVELLSASSKAEKLELFNQLAGVNELINGSFRCDVFEGVLPGGLGTFRSRVMYFDLLGGHSLRLLCPNIRDNSFDLGRIGKGYSASAPGQLTVLWKGITTDTEALTTDTLRGGLGYRRRDFRRATMNVVLEIDWVSGGGVSVDRQRLRLSDRGREALAYAIEEARQHLRRFVESTSSSRYHLLNCRLVNAPAPKQNAFWITQAQQSTAWGAIRFPAVDATMHVYSSPEGVISWKSQPVTILPCLQSVSHDAPYAGITWHNTNTPPSRVVLYENYRRRLVPLWERVEKAAKSIISSQFPPSWKGLVGARFVHFGGLDIGRVIWNKDNPLVGTLTDATLVWCRTTFAKTVDPLQHKDDILSTKENACAWLAHSASNGQPDVWRGLIERDPSFLPLVFERALGKRAKDASILFWTEDSHRNRLDTISHSRWRSQEDLDSDASLLPPVSEEWQLIEDHGAPSGREGLMNAHQPRKRHGKQRISKTRRQ